MIPTEKVSSIRKHANRQITHILSVLQVPFRSRGDGLIQSCCPCKNHGGDGNNSTAFSWRTDIGRWVCWTHHCQESRGNDIFGLVSSIRGTNFVETVEWLAEVLSNHHIDIDENLPDPETLARGHSLFVHEPLKEDNIKFLQPDPQYLLNRGFDLNILRDYQAGFWSRPGTFMHDRVIFPIRDHESYLVGYTGRTVHNQEFFERRGLVYSKWVHGRYYNQWPKRGEFYTSSILFNLFRAKKYLKEYKKLILVESPLDGMKLEEANIHNWSATLGTNFCSAHRTLLIQCGILDLYVAYDNDLPKGPHQRRAGEDGWNRMHRIVGDLFNLHRVELPEGKGCSHLDVSTIKEIFKDIRC